MTKHITGSIVELTKLLGAREAMEVVNLAKRADRLEHHWVAEFERVIDNMTAVIISNARDTGKISTTGVDFGPKFMEHSYDVMLQALKSTETKPAVRAERLASPPKGKVPRSLKALREWWDKYRRSGRMSPRQKADADKLKQEFLKQLNKAWRESSDDFVSGSTARNAEAVEAIKRSAKVTASRAKMMVETETTHYFNKVRRDVYEASDDVTHYLYMAIRDHRTTKWCKTRHGLVYAKDDRLLDKETPPVHWNCRSELLPLTPHNANHAAIIKDRDRSRRQNSPEPLPKGWTGRS